MPGVNNNDALLYEKSIVIDEYRLPYTDTHVRTHTIFGKQNWRCGMNQTRGESRISGYLFLPAAMYGHN